MDNKTAEDKSGTLFLILCSLSFIILVAAQQIKSTYKISDAEYSLFTNQHIGHILLIGLVVFIGITVIFFLFSVDSPKSIKHTEITGKSLEVFQHVNEYELGKYIGNLQLTGDYIDKTQQTWGHTFKVTHYRWIGKYNTYVGSGWSYPINPGDIVRFNGSEYLVLASVHSTEYSITQIYKVFLVDI